MSELWQLTLAEAQSGPTFAEHSVVAVWQTQDELVRARHRGRGHNLVVGG